MEHDRDEAVPDAAGLCRVPPLSARLTAGLCDRARDAVFRFMVSRSAVTAAAVRRATPEGVTLACFCRPGEKRFTVFADSEGWLAP